METQRPTRRRRSRRRARKKQIAWMVFGALLIGIFVWTRILIERRNQETLFAEQTAARESAKGAKAPVAPNATKNLILFVGRGYGIATTTAARLYAVGEQGQLAIDRFPESALVRTYSKNAQSGDSAAAMSAYMTGVKVDNEVIAQSADTRPYDETGRPNATRQETTCPAVGNGKPVPTLLELAKSSGRAVGVVTTARVTQAVTAASFAHLCQRDGENAIAVQLVPGGHDANTKLGEGVDVIFGGGWEHFLPKDDPRGSVRADARDLFAEMRAKGYAVIGRQAELAATTAPLGKVLGLFAQSRMKYESDRAGTTEPSLTDMTRRAIELLQRNPAGYLLVVEAGRIGDAVDGSQLRQAVTDALAFDLAIDAALTKVRELDPDLRNTTLVVTADHDQTLVLNGNSIESGRSAEGRPAVLGALRSYTDPTSVAFDATGRPYTNLVTAVGRRVKGSRAQAPAVSDLVVAERDYRYEAAIDVGPRAPAAAGGSDVMLSAIGANATNFHGTLDNTQVFTLLRSAMGL